jgi:hypothetical protein
MFRNPWLPPRQQFEWIGHGGLLTFGKHDACHVTSTAFEDDWSCSVFRTEDSLVVMQMGGAGPVGVHWEGGPSTLLAGDVLRVPMSQRPVLLTFGESALLVTVAPSEYADNVPVFLVDTATFVKWRNNYLLTNEHVDWQRLCDDIIPEHVAVLVKAGLDVNRTDKDGNTLLHTVCSRGSLDVVVALLATRQCEINATNHKGQTALWCALVRETHGLAHNELARHLLRAGAIFGPRADAKVRDVFLLADPTVKKSLCRQDETWEATLDRLIYGA